MASEETIETSVIVEVGGEGEWEELPAPTASPMVTDHCYTFKRGIKPKDLDKAKAKAAMLGEGGTQQQQYTYILPKNPTTQVTNDVTVGLNILYLSYRLYSPTMQPSPQVLKCLKENPSGITLLPVQYLVSYTLYLEPGSLNYPLCTLY